MAGRLLHGSVLERVDVVVAGAEVTVRAGRGPERTAVGRTNWWNLIARGGGDVADELHVRRVRVGSTEEHCLGVSGGIARPTQPGAGDKNDRVAPRVERD